MSLDKETTAEIDVRLQFFAASFLDEVKISVTDLKVI